MDFSGPILAVGRVKRGAMPRTGADPKCLIVEVRTPITRGQFIELEITEKAASDMVARLQDFVDDGSSENWRSLEGELEKQASRERGE